MSSDQQIQLKKIALTFHQRRIAWAVMSHSRFQFDLPIHPYFDTATVLLHNYAASVETTPYSFVILMVTALSVSLKQLEMPRANNTIFKEILRGLEEITTNMKPEQYQSIIGQTDFTYHPMTDAESKAYGDCEIDLLSSVNYNLDFDLPYRHIVRNVEPYINLIPNVQAQKMVLNSITQKICSIHISICKIPFPTEMVAVYVTILSFHDIQIPTPIKEWIDQVHSSFSNDTIEQTRAFVDKHLSRMHPDDKNNHRPSQASK